MESKQVGSKSLCSGITRFRVYITTNSRLRLFGELLDLALVARATGVGVDLSTSLTSRNTRPSNPPRLNSHFSPLLQLLHPRPRYHGAFHTPTRRNHVIRTSQPHHYVERRGTQGGQGLLQGDRCRHSRGREAGRSTFDDLQIWMKLI